MMSFFLFLFLTFKFLAVFSSEEKPPTVLISILVRNKAHTLPYFLTLLEKQEYEKRRLSLQIASDHNQDISAKIVKKWLEKASNEYHSVEFIHDKSSEGYSDESGVAHWSEQRFAHVIGLREAALDTARRKWADFVMFLDADVFLTNPHTLRYLVSRNHTVVAPMLKSTGLYSNFWCGMTEDFYYTRTDDYKPILKGERKGCFDVPMVHSAALVNLRRVQSDDLTFKGSKVPHYKGPTDDIITFAVTANLSGVPLHVCNEETFGWVMVPMEQHQNLDFDREQLTNLKLESLVDDPPWPVASSLEQFVTSPPRDTLGLDAIYVVNLQRREERRRRMEECLQELGLAAQFVDAVDGRSLDDEALNALGVRMMPEYKDPYHQRPMTRGEIGCFLSHYGIWQQVVERGEEMIMVLEDDVRFEPFFRRKVLALLEETKQLKLKWDLIYLGRKRLKEDEDWVEGSQSLVYVTYSYWTLGYLLTLQGARKLLEPGPLAKLLPVDEYIPIMFDKHPEDSWKAQFPQRNLVAFSAAPLLLYPTHYTGETGYISDTENSATVKTSPQLKEDL